MTLFELLDVIHRNNALQLQKTFTIWKDSEVQAAGFLIKAQRSLFKWVAIPNILFIYLLINLGIMKAPKATAFPAYVPKPKPPEPVKEKAPSEEVLPNS